MNLYKEEKLFYKSKQWNNENQIIFEDVTKIYKTNQVEIMALNKLNLEIKKNEFLGIMGPSGSGKTTFMKILVGLIYPTIGSVYVKQDDNSIIDISNLNYDEITQFRLNHIGYIQQHFILFGNLTALENVIFPKLLILENKKQFITDEMEEEIQNNALELMRYVDIYDRRFHKVEQMSGGEQQRVAIAAALIKNPKIIAADEPTGELDSKNSQKIFELFKNIAHEKHTTVICVTHNTMIKNYADRILNIVDGVIEYK